MIEMCPICEVEELLIWENGHAACLRCGYFYPLQEE